MIEKLIDLVHNARMNALWHNAPNPSEYITDMLIAEGVTIQKWISVKDRLPEKITNKVIVLCKNGYRGFGHYENYKGKQTWYNLENDRPFTDWDLEDCESYEVTHWMPLPQPPKGE